MFAQKYYLINGYEELGKYGIQVACKFSYYNSVRIYGFIRNLWFLPDLSLVNRDGLQEQNPSGRKGFNVSLVQFLLLHS